MSQLPWAQMLLLTARVPTCSLAQIAARESSSHKMEMTCRVPSFVVGVEIITEHRERCMPRCYPLAVLAPWGQHGFQGRFWRGVVWVVMQLGCNKSVFSLTMSAKDVSGITSQF